MRAKIYSTLLIILSIGVIVGFFYFKGLTDSMRTENAKLKKEKSDELKRVRDSAYFKIDTLISISKFKLDSLSKLPPEIKYIPYEKPVYPNRTLDGAIDVHSRYKANKSSTEKNR